MSLRGISLQRSPGTYPGCLHARNPVPLEERILVKFGVYSTTSAEVSFGTSLEYLCWSDGVKSDYLVDQDNALENAVFLGTSVFITVLLLTVPTWWSCELVQERQMYINSSQCKVFIFRVVVDV